MAHAALARDPFVGTTDEPGRERRAFPNRAALVEHWCGADPCFSVRSNREQKCVVDRAVVNCWLRWSPHQLA